jgi:hypothetical protein
MSLDALLASNYLAHRAQIAGNNDGSDDSSSKAPVLNTSLAKSCPQQKWYWPQQP